MKVYVATSFANKQVAKEFNEKLKEMDIEISHDWTGEHEGNRTGEELERYLHNCAIDDLEGVQECDLFVLLTDDRGRAAFTEFGLALAWGKKIVIVESEKSSNIFFHLGKEHKIFFCKDVHHALGVCSLSNKQLKAHLAAEEFEKLGRQASGKE